jgi:glycosyltransferase XagB
VAVLLSAYTLIMLVVAFIASTTLVWMLHAWRTPDALAATGFSGGRRPPRFSFSLIVPARHEQAVLERTLRRLLEQTHPTFEIICVVGHDDPETEAIARKVAETSSRLFVAVDHSPVKNKPKALNTALAACRGDIVGVFDAEDDVHPELLERVDGAFTETGADIVQGGVQLMDFDSSWYSLRNVLEYYFWFRSRLHFHAEQRFIPLGGNTVFIRAELIRGAGGWDPECLAEDCELGVRLSAQGARTVVAYDPAVATREETPSSISDLVKQRTRWNQGFLQVLRKGEWKGLPRRQRTLGAYTLAMPFGQALIGLLVPLAFLTMVVLKAPVLVTMIAFIPLVPALITLVVETVALSEFCRDYGMKARFRDYLRLILGTLPYQVLLSWAALRAVWRDVTGRRDWEKTSHAGNHIGLGTRAAEGLESA